MAELTVTVPVIDYLRELGEAKVHTIDGFTHIEKGKEIHLFKPPVPRPIEIGTLSGFIKLIDEGFEAFAPDSVMVHVSAYDQVELVARTSDPLGRRQAYVTAKATKPERVFTFGSYYQQEEFNIALRTMFVETDELRGLVELAGNIATQAEVRQKDDGFTQEVTTKGGVHLVEQKTIKPRVTLMPFRTFLEVDQPAGDYIVRVKTGNLLALFEADAGRWKLTAMDTIAAWIRTKLAGSEDPEVQKIPVVA